MYTVAVMTGTRADYGLLRGVVQKIAQSGRALPRLLVTGSHLSEAHGHTVDEIEADGFEIAAKLDIMSQIVPEGRVGTAHRTAQATQLFIDWLVANRPDALLLLGDRYEAFAAGQAAALLNIPLVHISGGDVTAGADDDWFRHCLTKMAKLHFPSCEAYSQRIIRMGEEPFRVFNVGGLGDENIRNMQMLRPKTLGAGLGVDLERPYALVTLHPETLSTQSPRWQVEQMLAAFERHTGLFYLITGANADAGGAEMNGYLEAFCTTHPESSMFVPSLGIVRYLSAMRGAAVVVGNSSSGVVETPSFVVPTVDIGNRQLGRVAGENVIHCAMRVGDITEAMEKALSPEFRQAVARAKSPYNGGETSQHIVDILLKWLEEGLFATPKLFFDGPPKTKRR